ncbi:MAG: lamin tail domain-containing protein, partial [Elusimicrobiota bacterium]|nr:lamin tail domain-containing protein [Elusimicrobiota bacterium]
VPSTITDLVVTSGDSPGSLKLVWTAPGDDGTSGTTAGYVVRFEEVPINALNFDNFYQVDNWKLSLLWYPKEAGSTEEYTIAGLDKNTVYYVAIVAEDETGNKSAVSNCPSASSGDTVGSLIRINEVAPKIEGGKDWVELYNAHTSSVNLSGWKIYQRSLTVAFSGDNARYEEEELYEFPSFQLGAGDYVTLNFMTEGVDLTCTSNADGSKHYQLFVKNQTTENKQIDELKDWLMLRDSQDVMDDFVLWSSKIGVWNSQYWSNMISAARSYHQWYPSNASEYYAVDTSAMSSSQSINRNESSNDTDDTDFEAKGDWRVTGHTKGYKNDWTAPAAVTAFYNVSASTSTEGALTLSWTAPGDDGTMNNNTGGYYELKYSTVSADVGDYDGVWWDAVGSVSGYQANFIFGSPVAAGETETRAVTGLYPGNTFYFCVKTYDDVGNVSTITAHTSLFLSDSTPPLLERSVPSWVRSSTSTVALYWQAGPLDVAYYVIQRKQPDGVWLLWPGSRVDITTSTNYTDTNISTTTSSEGKYVYRISAVDFEGNASTTTLDDLGYLEIFVYNDYSFPAVILPDSFPNAVYMKGNDFKFNLYLDDDSVIQGTTTVNYFRSNGVVTTVQVLDADSVSDTFTGVPAVPASFVSGGDFSYYIDYSDYASRSTRTPTVNVTVMSSQTFTWTQGVTRTLTDGNDSDGFTSIVLGSVDGELPTSLEITQTDIPLAAAASYSFPTGTAGERVDTSVNGGMPVICWDIDPKDADGYDMDVTFADPVQIKLLYLERSGNVYLADGSSLGSLESRLKAYFLDERNHVWRYVGGTQNTSANTLTFNFPHLSRFALFATEAGGIKPVQRFLTARTPVDFDEASKVVIYDPRGREVVTLTTGSPLTWYGADRETASSVPASQMVESGAYIYEATGAGGAKATGVIIVVK